MFRTIVRLATTGTADATSGAIEDPPEVNPNGGRDDAEGFSDGVYPFYTQLATAGGDGAFLEDASDASLYAVRNRNVAVTFMAWMPDLLTDGDPETRL